MVSHAKRYFFVLALGICAACSGPAGGETVAPQTVTGTASTVTLSPETVTTTMSVPVTVPTTVTSKISAKQVTRTVTLTKTVAPTTESASSGLVDFTCDDLAEQAVEISEGNDVELIKVRSPEVVEDNRLTYEEPNDDSSVVVFSCSGTGVWSNNEEQSVLVKATVDSDGDFFVGYEQQ